MRARTDSRDWTHLRVLDTSGVLFGQFRVAVLLVLSAAAAVLPNLPNGKIVALILLVEALIAQPLERRIDPGKSDYVRVVSDHVTALTIAALIPALWSAAALTVVANCIWSSLRAHTLATHLLVSVSVISLIGVGVVRQPAGWVYVSVVAVTLTSLYYILGHRLRQAVEANEDDLVQALSTSGAMVHISNAVTGQVESVVGPIEEVLGWTAEEWMTTDHATLIHPDDRETFWVNADDLEENTVLDRRGRFRREDGSYAWIRDVSRVVQSQTGQLQLRGFSMDVTEIEHAQQVIRRQAETDELTGLANRSVLIADMERRLHEGESFALALLDLNRFKNINDTLGHGFGDSVLIEIGRRLRTLGRASDAVVRLGGDEFALVVADLENDEEATTLARRIATTCGRVMSLQGVTITVGASIGVTLAPRDGADVQTLLRHADIAMYEAKREGRSFQIFDPSIQQAPLEDVTLSASIGAALSNDEFVLHFQPKVDMRTGAVIGFEGLARWEHPKFGLLSPDRFIHLVTISDFSRAFTDRVFDLGAAFAARCAVHGHRVSVAVNISARSLLDDALPERVAKALSRHRVSPDQLVIEITEHDIMNNTAANSQVLARLDGLGVALSIDDFGTGYSSLARLVDLPVGEIKVDRRFVSRATVDTKDAVIVRSIVDLGRNLELKVIAEGIETEEEAALLQSFGCHLAQGYLFSRPLVAADALATLEQNLLPSSGVEAQA